MMMAAEQTMHSACHLWITPGLGSFPIGMELEGKGAESMRENHLIWLIMRSSLDKKEDKADGVDGFKEQVQGE